MRGEGLPCYGGEATLLWGRGYPAMGEGLPCYGWGATLLTAEGAPLLMRRGRRVVYLEYTEEEWAEGQQGKTDRSWVWSVMVGWHACEVETYILVLFLVFLKIS